MFESVGIWLQGFIENKGICTKANKQQTTFLHKRHTCLALFMHLKDLCFVLELVSVVSIFMVSSKVLSSCCNAC
jgi:hypothetical protein